MASLLFSLLLLAPLISARITIHIAVSEDASRRFVDVAGTIDDVISDLEREAFELSDESLKDAVAQHHGREPDQAYLRSPTPWEDLYQMFGWAQVTGSLTPTRTRILSFTSQHTTVLTQHFKNSKDIEDFPDKIRKAVQNTVSIRWENFGTLEVSEPINHNISVQVPENSVKVQHFYPSKWGENSSHVLSETVSDIHDLAVEEDHTAVLFAVKATMTIQLDFEATLSGDTAVNYDSAYDDHHFWALDINSVMSAGHLPGKVSSSEVINLVFFYNPSVVVTDSSTKSLVQQCHRELSKNAKVLVCKRNDKK